MFDIRATVNCDAPVVLDAMHDMYGPARGGSIRLTHGSAIGQTVHVWIEYDVCGGHPADMRRMLKKVLDRTSSTLVDDPVIAVVSRTLLTDDGQPVSPAPEP